MQKIKQTLAVLLAVLMLVCAVPYSAFALPAASTHTSSHKMESNFTVVTPATCTAEGLEEMKCLECEFISKNVIPKTAHNWAQVATEAYLKTPATCQEQAVYYKSCSVCKLSAKNETNANELTFKSGAVNPDNHPADKLENVDPNATVVPATCTAAGTTPEQKCKACQATIASKITPALGHTEDAPEKAATCESKAVCARCHQEFGAYDPDNHPANKIKIDAAREATCSQTSLTEGKHCEACGTTIVAQVEGAKKNHEYVTVNEPATCEKDGVQGRVECKFCHAAKLDDAGNPIEGTVLPKAGHTWGDWEKPEGYDCTVGGTIKHTCSVCKKSETKTMAANSHEAVTDKRVEPTCTKTGLTEGQHCALCSKVLQKQEEIPANGHTFTGEAKPSGTEKGTHSYKCINCDEIGNETACVDENHDCVCDICKQQLQHKFEVYTPNGDATCQKDGTKTATCSVCGVAKDTQPDVDSHLKAQHKYKYVYQDDATCLKNGHEIGTCELCGAVSDPIEKEGTALGHKETDWRLSPNFDCEVGGYREKVCERCGEQLAREEIESKPHNVVVAPAVAVTCEEDGKTEGTVCSVCGKVYIPQEIIPKLGHKADEKGFTLVKEPGCEEAGLEEAFCVNCQKTFTREVAAIGHDYTAKVVAPTCTEKGYTLHTCKNCGGTYIDTPVKKTGHTWKLTVKPATRKKDGKRIYDCTVCKARVVKVINKIDSVKLAETKIVKDGKKHNPAVIVKDSAGKKLKKGKDYTVKYTGGRKAIGSYTVTVTFIGRYSGTKDLKFHIIPAAPKAVKATAAKGSVALKWSKVSGGDRYIVYYSTKQDSGYKKVGTTANTNTTVKNLKSGKTYYFKVKAVRVLEKGNFNGVASVAAKATVK